MQAFHSFICSGWRSSIWWMEMARHQVLHFSHMITGICIWFLLSLGCTSKDSVVCGDHQPFRVSLFLFVLMFFFYSLGAWMYSVRFIAFRLLNLDFVLFVFCPGLQGRRSPKWSAIILWKPWLCMSNFMAIFQSDVNASYARVDILAYGSSQMKGQGHTKTFIKSRFERRLKMFVLLSFCMCFSFKDGQNQRFFGVCFLGEQA